MATHNIAAGEIGAHNVTLVANTVEYFVFADDAGEVIITNLSNTAAIYYTYDDSDPTVGGANTRVISQAMWSTRFTPTGSGQTRVKVISSGTPTISVTRA